MSRKLLVASAAAAPLLLYAGAGLAQVEVTSSSRTTPISTSSPNDGAADDVKVTTDGVITLSVSGPIITLDSNNTITMSGALASSDIDDSVGILVIGGKTGSVTSDGSISLLEDYTVEDSDEDGDYDGSLAKGYRRYGIRLTGTDPFTGTISHSGTISIEGMDSAGISLEAPLIGNFTHSGTISVTGDRGYGVRIAAPVTGAVRIEGSTSVIGQGSVGVAIDAPIDGALVLQGSVYSSGYRVTTRYTDPDDRALIDEDDRLEGGGGVNIAASVTGGVLLDVPPTDTNDDTTDDEDGDGVADNEEGSASIASVGGAPALRVGSNTAGITLGAVGVDDNAYGLIIKGSVGASSPYDGVETTGVQIGGDGGYETLITNGIRIGGVVSSSAYEAQTSGLRLKAGAVAETIWNTGAISAASMSEGDFSARAVVIETGALSRILNNDGAISATVAGENGNAYGILDNAGTLTSITNTRTITAYVVPTDDEYDTDDDNTDSSDEAMTGKAIAIDVSKNSSGVVITQIGVNDGDDGADEVADVDTDGDGVDDADEPAIIGKIMFGAGDDSLKILNGTLVGSISFGDGADKLVIDGGGYVLTSLSDSDGRLDITIGDGALGMTNTGDLKISTLTLGAQSKMVFSVDPAGGTATRILADTATIETGANLGLILNNLLTTATTFEVIKAGSLTAGDIGQDLLGDAPYLYVAKAYQSGNSIDIDVRRRTAAEAGMTRNQASAYDAVFAALSKNEDITSTFLQQTTRDGFYNLYNQMLPDQGLGMASALQAVNQQISAATAIRPDLGERYGPDSVWAQQINTLVRRESDDSQGSDTQALGFVAGYEAMGDAGGALGVTLAMVNIEEHGTVAKVGEHVSNSMVLAGLYWRRSVGGWRFNLGGGGGYGWLTGERSFYSEDVNGDGVADVAVKNVAHWNGAAANAFAGVAYEQPLGRAFLRPEARLDYVYFSEGRREESGGGDGFDLIVDSRAFSNLSGDLGLVLGAQFGKAVWWRPEVRVGYRKSLSGSVGDTVARFRGGDSFILTSTSDPEGAATLSFALRAGSALSYLALEGGAEASRKTTRYYMRFSGRAMF